MAETAQTTQFSLPITTFSPLVVQTLAMGEENP